MEERRRARELGVTIGLLTPGQLNSITDVPGVEVGHLSLVRGEGKLVPGTGPVRTGVTVIKPHPGNLFLDKVPAAVHVINGFGKTIGLVQIVELGVIETPIVLTNTLCAGLAADGLIEYMLRRNPDIGVTTGSVNPVVGECNDSFLNDLQGRHVKQEHVLDALAKTSSGPVEEGSIGAGVGMSAFGYKGGIGTSSRRVDDYTIGALVLVNCGRKEELIIAGFPVGAALPKTNTETNNDGSIMIVIATDAPLSARQLGRLAKRATHGLARTGANSSHGSGDIVITFSTATYIPHYSASSTMTLTGLHESSKELSRLFCGVAEATEEAIVNALFTAQTVVGRDGNQRLGLPIRETLAIIKEG
ncbi:TPA: aminopeptidase [Candidatus Acetothermia bacterium]|nr:aminopeptidase [Candidatus Acetothermia bacterium]